MSLFNFVMEDWTCPFCGDKQIGGIYFDYGMCGQYQYKVGDKLTWEGSGRRYRERLPDGTGVVDGIGLCANSWAEKPHFGTPTIAERKSLGCPQRILISVELVNDVIHRVFVRDDIESVVEGDW